MMLAPQEQLTHATAARLAYRTRRFWDALELVSTARFIEPANSEAALLHGAILGELGDLGARDELYRRACSIYWSERGEDCRFLRGYGLAAARLGRWKSTLRAAKQISRQSTDVWHTHATMTLVQAAGHGALHRLGPSAALEFASRAEEVFGPLPEAREVRALAYCQLGRYEDALQELGTDETQIKHLPDDIRVELGNALLISSKSDKALALLSTIPIGRASPHALLLLAQAAMRCGAHRPAKKALDQLAKSDSGTRVIADIAVQVLEQLEQDGEQAALRVLATQWITLGASVGGGQVLTGYTPWEVSANEAHRGPMSASLNWPN